MSKRCTKYGTMSGCKEELYEYPDENETLCYYHRKVRDGLITRDHEDVGGLFV